MLRRASTQARRKSNISGVAVPKPTRSLTVYGFAENFRTVMTGPVSESGGMIAFTVGQASVDLGARLVDAAAHRGDDPIDDVHDVLVVPEGDVRQL